MSDSQVDKHVNEPPPAPAGRSHKGIFALLFAGLALAVAGNVYQFTKSEQLSREIRDGQRSTDTRIAKLTDAAQAALAENQQRYDNLKDDLKNELQGSAAATLRQARSDLKRSSTEISADVERRRQELEQRHQEVVNQLSELKADTGSKLDQVSTDIQRTGTDLKHVMGDLGVMGGEVATNSKELATLKQLGERNYFEFNLSKAKVAQKFGDIRIVLKKADPKHNRYTMEVWADDKKVEKKDRTINEPVQLYVSGSRQPYEIVVNEVKKNQVVGYVAAPKVKNARS